MINLAKRKIYGWNITPREMHEISRILGIEGNTSWEEFKYLGVPIIKAIPKATHWNHMIERIKNRIHSWGANWLNIAGKVVLIKAVLTSIPIYQSALLLAPRSVIQKIEALIRHFLWEGGKQTGRKLHLISWGKISKPYLEGGLQLKDLQTQNLALGEKILWNIISGKSNWSKRALWKKYFRGPRKKCLGNPTKLGKGSPIFSLCQKVLQAFLTQITWIPGNGKDISIWEDSVLGEPTLSTRQDLRRLRDWMQTNSLHKLWDISAWRNDENISWSRWEIANLPQDLEEEWTNLKNLLQGKTPLCEKRKDKIGWGHHAGPYTTAAGYSHLASTPHVPPDPVIWKAIWTVKSLPKIDMFVWTVAQKGVLSGENLRKRGWEGPSRCPLCLQEEESMNHLLLVCPFASEVWQLALGLGALAPNLPQEIHLLLSNWQALCPFRTANQGHLLALWRSIPKFILWKIWLERNNRLFREEKRTPAQVATRIKALFSESAPYFIKASNLRPLGQEEEGWLRHLGLQNISAIGPSNSPTCSWELRMDKIKLEEWKNSMNSNFLSFDGASKGNLGEAGGGGIISNPIGNIILRYAWGIGIDSNNKVEALALWQGLTQALILNIQDLIVLGDSRILIQALNQNTRVANGQLQHVIDKINLLRRQFHSIQLFHVLRGNNAQADEEANVGARLEKGCMRLNGVIVKRSIP
jgi:ribonuclease HI